MLKKFLIYGFAGWVVEVLFTGTAAAISKDRAGTAKTYLWMHPIYGLTALGMEAMAKTMKRHRVPRVLRGLAYTGVIYAAEYSSGWALKKFLGKCPWDYSGCGRDIHGLVRLDYAPAWYTLGMLFEPVANMLEESAEPARARAGKDKGAWAQVTRLPSGFPRMPGNRGKKSTSAGQFLTQLLAG